MKARTKIFLFLLLCIIYGTTALPLKAQSFDIKAFSDTTKYGWKNYLDRNAHRQDLKQRQDLLQIYEMEAQLFKYQYPEIRYNSRLGTIFYQRKYKRHRYFRHRNSAGRNFFYFLDRALRI